MYKKFISTICSILVFLLILPLSCSKTEDSLKATTYTFGGSSTVAPIMNDAIPKFEEKEGVKVSYETLGSSVGLKQLISGTLTLAGSSRELKQSEIESGLKPIVIALDGLSVAVNKDVGIENITLDDLASVFAGEITNWKELGGKDEKIELIVRDETSGTYGSFKEIVLDKAKKEVSENAIVARENGEVAIKISSTPGAIGYIGMAFNHIVEESGGKVLSINSVKPTAETVTDGTYPISRPLYLVTKGDLQDGVEKDYIDFILSNVGQEVVESNGFIRIN